jgi:hypothetical protein
MRCERTGENEFVRKITLGYLTLRPDATAEHYSSGLAILRQIEEKRRKNDSGQKLMLLYMKSMLQQP